MANAVYLVATDLDGTLLDHDDYSYEAALPALQLLEELRIPVIFVSSKTRSEILALREELGNEHPFIVENGAAVYIPDGYFTSPPEGSIGADGFQFREFVPRRERWTMLLGALRERFPDSFQDFATAGVDEIAAMTGLSTAQAVRANEREYSEPVQWRGSASDLDAFLAALHEGGARTLRGGRFISVAGGTDKGEAWRWLREQYLVAAQGREAFDLALGDGQNDVPLLEVTHRAALIPAPGRPLPQLERSEGILRPSGYGPDAWAVAAGDWLKELYTASSPGS
ncbi:MAG: HAD-IIB family hydrolase [Pseudomonadota bacterium]